MILIMGFFVSLIFAANTQTSFPTDKFLVMNRIFVILLAFATISTTTLKAQSVLQSATQAGKLAGVLPIGDITETANSIMGVLKPKLSLTEKQSPKVIEIVTNFLQAKSGIIDSAKTNPAAYVSQFGEIKDKLQSSLKAAITASQFKSMLALKPKTSSSSNVLSHLFY